MAMARMHNKEVIMITVLLVKATLDRDGSFPFSKPSTFPLYPHLASLLSCCLVLFFFFSVAGTGPMLMFNNGPLYRSDQYSHTSFYAHSLSRTDNLFINYFC